MFILLLYEFVLQSPIVPSRRDGHICAGENPAEGDRMIFEKLASFVMKHAKLVVIVWIVILLLSVYPALHAGEKLSYSTSSMGSSDTESIEGLILIGQHFESQSDNESMQMVLVVYDNATDAQLTALNNNLIAIPASDSKVSSVIPAGTFTNESGSHMNMYAVSYNTEVNSDGISDDTGNLRNLVRTAASNAFAGSTVAYKTYVTE